MREEEPLAVDVGKVIRVDHARLGLGGSGLAVVKPELTFVGGGLGKSVDDIEIQDRLGTGAK